MGASSSIPQGRLPPERTFIVTGANTGIGYETAKKIAQLGGRVIIACRSEQKANDAIERMKKEIKEVQTAETDPVGELQYMNLDLSSFTSTIEFARRFKKTGLPLHALVCNAGLISETTTYTGDGFERQFQVNYLSHFLLTILLLPLLKKSAPNARIVNVSSGAHLMGELKLDNIRGETGSGSYSKYYGNSKLYQIMNMHSLSKAISGSGISIFSLHPGIVDTEVFREASGVRGTLLKRVVSTAGKSAKNGARTSLIATLDPTYDGETALYFSGGKPVPSSNSSRSQAKQDILWKFSLQCLRDYLDDATLQEIGEKLENIQPLSATS